MNLENYVNLLKNNLLLEFHDNAYNEVDLDCYYLLKALKRVNYELYIKVANISTTSSHGHKAAFRRVVAKYITWNFDYNHPEDKGGKLLPLIVDYFKINSIDSL